MRVSKSVFRTGMHITYIHHVEMVLHTLQFTKHTSAEQVLARDVRLGMFQSERLFDIRACYVDDPSAIMITLQFAREQPTKSTGSTRIHPFCTTRPSDI